MNENIMVPPPLHPLLADRSRGRGRPDSNNRKNSDKGVFCWFFFATIFFYGSKGSKHLSGGGGGGATFYYLLLFFIFYFFFFGGGGLQILIFIETYITCDFSGGGGPDHLSLSGLAHG